MVMIEALIAGISFFIGFCVTYIPLKSEIEKLKKKIEEQDSTINGFVLTRQSKFIKDDENEQKTEN